MTHTEAMEDVEGQTQFYIIKRRSDCTIVELNRNVDSMNFSSIIDGLIKTLVFNRYKKIVLSMGQVEMLQSVAIGKLVELEKTVRGYGGSFTVCGIQPMILRVLKITHIDQLLEIFPDEESALHSFGDEETLSKIDSSNMRVVDEKPSTETIVSPIESSTLSGNRHRAAYKKQLASEKANRSLASPATGQTRTDNLQTVQSNSSGAIFDVACFFLLNKIAFAVISVVVLGFGYQWISSGTSVNAACSACDSIYREYRNLQESEANATDRNFFHSENTSTIVALIMGLAKNTYDSELAVRNTREALASLIELIDPTNNETSDLESTYLQKIKKAKDAR